jgi:hypothetical protein
VIVTVVVPTGVDDVVVSVSVLVVCPVAMVAGLNVPVTPDARPEVASVTGPVKAPIRPTLIVTEPLEPCTMESDGVVAMANEPVVIGLVLPVESPPLLHAAAAPTMSTTAARLMRAMAAARGRQVPTEVMQPRRTLDDDDGRRGIVAGSDWQCAKTASGTSLAASVAGRRSPVAVAGRRSPDAGRGRRTPVAGRLSSDAYRRSPIAGRLSPVAELPIIERRRVEIDRVPQQRDEIVQPALRSP